MALRVTSVDYPNVFVCTILEYAAKLSWMVRQSTDYLPREVLFLAK